MEPEVLEAHMVPMRAETWYGFEGIVEHRSLEECRHEVTCEESQDDEAFKRLRKFEPGERLNTGGAKPAPGDHMDERRQWRLLVAPRNDWGSVAVGLPRHERPELGAPQTVRVMPSQDLWGPHGMRNTSRKLATAELYSSRYHRRSRSGSRGSSSEVDYTALAEVMGGL